MPDSSRKVFRGSLVVGSDPCVNDLLNTNPLALLLGMLLDQQTRIEWAFSAPSRLAQRLDRNLDAATIAAMPLDEFVALAVQKPAIHRFPAMMAKRIHTLCEYLLDHYDNKPESIWEGSSDADVVHKRLLALPGFGTKKAQIFLALLVKRFDQRLSGWEAICGEYAKDGLFSVADLKDEDSLRLLRAARQGATA